MPRTVLIEHRVVRRVRPLATAGVRACAVVAAIAAGRPAQAQRAASPPLTREAAVTLAVSRGAQAALASADARVAYAALLTARAYPNPTLTTSYSKAVPQYHATVDLPFDYLTLRPLRVASALSASQAADYRLAFARASVRFDVETLYTRASTTAARAVLSRRNVVAADSLLTIATVRRDAGDASDLDVELARVSAGQAENAAASDSLTDIAALLELQLALGLPAGDVAIALADSLTLPRLDSIATPGAGTPLAVAAADRELRAAEQAVALERRSVWSGFAVTAGVEGHDPTGSERGVLPTVGVSVPLPLLNQRRGERALAEASRDRALATLEFARRESAAQIARVRREVIAASVRAERDRALVASANRVAALSLTAYREGASPLASVLEAQRSARDALVQLIDDLAAATNAASAVRLYTGTAPPR